MSSFLDLIFHNRPSTNILVLLVLLLAKAYGLVEVFVNRNPIPLLLMSVPLGASLGWFGADFIVYNIKEGGKGE